MMIEASLLLLLVAAFGYVGMFSAKPPCEDLVDPYIVKSRDNHMTLSVRPSTRRGIGDAQYSLTCDSDLIWNGTLPFACKVALLTSAGTAAGISYDAGLFSSRYGHNSEVADQLRFVIIDQKGSVAYSQLRDRVSPQRASGHTPTPWVEGLFLSQDQQRAIALTTETTPIETYLVSEYGLVPPYGFLSAKHLTLPFHMTDQWDLVEVHYITEIDTILGLWKVLSRSTGSLRYRFDLVAFDAEGLVSWRSTIDSVEALRELGSSGQRRSLLDVAGTTITTHPVFSGQSCEYDLQPLGESRRSLPRKRSLPRSDPPAQDAISIFLQQVGEVQLASSLPNDGAPLLCGNRDELVVYSRSNRRFYLAFPSGTVEWLEIDDQVSGIEWLSTAEDRSFMVGAILHGGTRVVGTIEGRVTTWRMDDPLCTEWRRQRSDLAGVEWLIRDSGLMDLRAGADANLWRLDSDDKWFGYFMSAAVSRKGELAVLTRRCDGISVHRVHPNKGPVECWRLDSGVAPTAPAITDHCIAVLSSNEARFYDTNFETVRRCDLPPSRSDGYWHAFSSTDGRRLILMHEGESRWMEFRWP